jgi:hypothetical protein
MCCPTFAALYPYYSFFNRISFWCLFLDPHLTTHHSNMRNCDLKHRDLKTLRFEYPLPTTNIHPAHQKLGAVETWICLPYAPRSSRDSRSLTPLAPLAPSLLLLLSHLSLQQASLRCGRQGFLRCLSQGFLRCGRQASLRWGED